MRLEVRSAWSYGLRGSKVISHVLWKTGGREQCKCKSSTPQAHSKPIACNGGGRANLQASTRISNPQDPEPESPESRSVWRETYQATGAAQQSINFQSGNVGAPNEAASSNWRKVMRRCSDVVLQLLSCL